MSAAPTPDDLDPALRAWLEPLVGEVTLVRPLVGGITAQMLHLRTTSTSTSTSTSEDLVVRRWREDPAQAAPRVHREARMLRALAGSDLPVPRLLAEDPDGRASGRPTTLTTFCPGEVDLAPSDLRTWVRRLAEMLVRIHGTPVLMAGEDTEGIEPCAIWEPEDPSWLATVADPGLARDAVQLASRRPDPADAVLSHGDFQHFNVLWEGGNVSAVVGWPNGGVADRGLDVGHCRLNLAVLFSPDAAMAFLDDVEERAGVRIDPAVDVQRLLCFGRDWQDFIPVQVAGRRPVDGPGMARRVTETIERTLHRAG